MRIYKCSWVDAVRVTALENIYVNKLLTELLFVYFNIFHKYIEAQQKPTHWKWTEVQKRA